MADMPRRHLVSSHPQIFSLATSSRNSSSHQPTQDRMSVNPSSIVYQSQQFLPLSPKSNHFQCRSRIHPATFLPLTPCHRFRHMESLGIRHLRKSSILSTPLLRRNNRDFCVARRFHSNGRSLPYLNHDREPQSRGANAGGRADPRGG